MADKPKTLDEIMKEMNKKSEEKVVQFGITDYDFSRIPFTSPRLNYMTFGGLPQDKLIEFYGEEHGGKTTTALDSIANYQNMEDAKKVLYVDAENTLDVEWARKIGVDVDAMIVFKPTSHSAEEIFQFVLDMVLTGEIGFVVIDSLGALVSAQALDKSVADKTYAGISQALTGFSSKAEMFCHKKHCTIVGINQIRDDMNAVWASAVKTPGGRAWKHACAVRLQFTRGSFIDEKGNEIKRSSETPAGNIVLVEMTKNKTCPPTRRKGFYTITYEYGVDYIADLIELAIKYDVIDKSGAWFSILNPETGEELAKLQGQASVREFLDDEKNVEVLSMIEDYVDQQMQMN